MLATILFTDLVSSTERAAELGDREWTALLERHIGAARTSVSSYAGKITTANGAWNCNHKLHAAHPERISI